MGRRMNGCGQINNNPLRFPFRRPIDSPSPIRWWKCFMILPHIWMLLSWRKMKRQHFDLHQIICLAIASAIKWAPQYRTRAWSNEAYGNRNKKRYYNCFHLIFNLRKVIKFFTICLAYFFVFSFPAITPFYDTQTPYSLSFSASLFLSRTIRHWKMLKYSLPHFVLLFLICTTESRCARRMFGNHISVGKTTSIERDCVKRMQHVCALGACSRSAVQSASYGDAMDKKIKDGKLRRTHKTQ